MWACGNGHEAITLALLDAGADPLAVDKHGYTAEQRAAEQAQAEDNTEEESQRCRRCVELLRQPRVPIPWSPETHAQFPESRRKQAAALEWELCKFGFWIARRSPKVHRGRLRSQDGGSVALRDAWQKYVWGQLELKIRPMSRVV